MTATQRKEQLSALVNEYNSYKAAGKLDLTSEETIRTWLNQFLRIFGWDVRDTSQVLQEKVLSKEEKEHLKSIGSTNSRPDYTFKLAKQKITFLDAKDIKVSIKEDAEAAFQIKSYGWSIMAPCAFISNFEEFAIYDCTYVPEQNQNSSLGRVYLTIEEYVDQFDILDAHLLKENIYSGHLNGLYASTLTANRYIKRITPDIQFASQLSQFRLQLATDIFASNPGMGEWNAENLSYIVQIIINRILFIRVCESRFIEDEGLLKTFREQGFWQTFRNSSYFDFYEHYDGPLFERYQGIHDLNISDTVFDSLLELLYYPSPYRFDVIPTKVLSDIYEIFLSKKLVISGGVVVDELKSEYLKTRGAISTPQFIVQEVVRRTIVREKLLGGGIEQLLSNKILDIACGSGVFAIEAYDYLEEIFKELYIRNPLQEYDRYFVRTNNEILLNLSGRKAILEHCIYGVDIDAEAVEVAKMSLSLKVVDNIDFIEFYHEIGIFGSRILNGVGNNIKCGNSLVDSGIIEFYPAILDNHDELLKTNIFDWKSEDGFNDIFIQKGGFDFIIGNPPYVEVKNYNSDLPRMHQYIKSKYLSAKDGKIDLAVPFIEKSFDLLNETGRVGMVLQKRFFKTNYGRKIREIISESNHMSSLIDLESNEIFKGRTTYIALLFMDKSPSENFAYKFLKGKVENLPSILRTTPLPDVSPEDYLILPATTIDGNYWLFSDIELIQLRTRLQIKGTLQDFANVKVGIQALWDGAYHIRPSAVEHGNIRGKSHVDDQIEVEIGACRPLVCNEDFYPYREDKGDVYVIFPYDVTEGKVTPILFSEFKSRYPKAGKYLEKHKVAIEAEVETLPIKYPRRFTEEHWHLFTRANNHKATYPKILVPMTSLDTYASVTFSEKVYCDNANVFFIESPEKSETAIYALSAIINSSIFSLLARSIANPQREGYFKFNKQFLDPVPFPVEAFGNDVEVQQKLAALAKEIENSQRKYRTSSPNQKKTYARLLENYWNQLDAICCELYGLSDEELAFLNSKGRNMDRIKILN